MDLRAILLAEMMTTPHCVIVTYNGMKWLDRCLLSLRESTCSVQIIVVDNASVDNTCSFIESAFPEVRLIKNKSNLGFGQANNLGIDLALQLNARYVFLLNQDVYVQKDTLQKLVESADKSPDYGIISPIHLNGLGTAADAYFMQYFLKSHLQEWVTDCLVGNRTPANLISSEFVNAAAWLLTPRCIRKIGGFDPLFFHYGEDNNYCQRVLYHQFKIGIHASAHILHDRALRLNKEDDFQHRFNREWLNLLNFLADIRFSGFAGRFLKRFFRHGANLCVALLSLRPAEAKLHLLILIKMWRAVPQVSKSRRRAKYPPSIAPGS